MAQPQEPPGLRQPTLFNPEPRLGQLEENFRLSNLQGDIKQIQTLILIYLVIVLIYAPLDFEIVDHRVFLFLMITRGVFLFLSLAAVLLLRKLSRPQHVDMAILTWELAAVGLILLVNSTRSGSYFYNAALDVVVILTIYTAYPNRLMYRILPAGVLTLGDIVLMVFFRTGIPITGIRSMIVAYSFANSIGILISNFLYRWRRGQYLARLQETASRLEIERIAQMDGLTQVYNSRCFLELAEVEFKRFKRYHTALSLLIIDLDHFKLVNDTYGHLAGNLVLKEFATRTNNQVRATDHVGRVGGEEFAVLLSETHLEAALDVARRICSSCDQMVVPTSEGNVHVTCSVGVAQACDRHLNFDEIFRDADQALYLAKNKGRNQVAQLPTFPDNRL